MYMILNRCTYLIKCYHFTDNFLTKEKNYEGLCFRFVATLYKYNYFVDSELATSTFFVGVDDMDYFDSDRIYSILSNNQK